ncbi:MAG: hypothetical protein F6K18_05680 [Okeania sp. SIO2C2]|nr:hypothetical protein [Okeania sp. SIO2C2]
MQKIKIKLVTLGNLKYPVDFQFIKKWKSKIFSAEHLDQIQILPEMDGEKWSYTDKLLANLIKSDKNYDFTVGMINYRLEKNYYVRRVGKDLCMLSLYETAEIIHDANLTIENFIIRNLYEFCSIYLEYGRDASLVEYSVAHDETRSCLFDMCGNKADLVFSTARPRICEPCKARIMQSQLSNEFISNIEKELCRIRKSLYYRLTDFIKGNLILAITITSMSAILLSVIAKVIYDVFKSLLIPSLFQGEQQEKIQFLTPSQRQESLLKSE